MKHWKKKHVYYSLRDSMRRKLHLSIFTPTPNAYTWALFASFYLETEFYSSDLMHLQSSFHGIVSSVKDVVM